MKKQKPLKLNYDDGRRRKKDQVAGRDDGLDRRILLALFTDSFFLCGLAAVEGGLLILSLSNRYNILGLLFIVGYYGLFLFCILAEMTYSQSLGMHLHGLWVADNRGVRPSPARMGMRTLAKYGFFFLMAVVWHIYSGYNRYDYRINWENMSVALSVAAVLVYMVGAFMVMFGGRALHDWVCGTWVEGC